MADLNIPTWAVAVGFSLGGIVYVLNLVNTQVIPQVNKLISGLSEVKGTLTSHADRLNNQSAAIASTRTEITQVALATQTPTPGLVSGQPIQTDSAVVNATNVEVKDNDNS